MINKKSIQWLAQAVTKAVPTALLAAGAAAVSTGVGMLCVPAGVIAAGALAIVAGVLLIKGGGDGT